MKASVELRAVGPRNVGAFAFAMDATERNNQVAALIAGGGLAKLGISGLSPFHVERMMDGQKFMRQMATGMDAAVALTPTVTTPSIGTPVQFLQNWLPGFVQVVTGARKIDDFVGISTSGNWEDDEVVQGILEGTGKAVLYGDITNVPFSSWNSNYERRTVVRFEEGMRAGVLEEARAGRANINSAEQKRNAATDALEIARNDVGFYGYNDGLGRTFGFLNDPQLPAASAFPATGTGNTTTWSTKDYLAICNDLRLMFAALRTQSQDRIDPVNEATTLGLPTSCIDYLSVTSQYGNSVWEWLKEAYPKCRVVSAPQLEDAIMGENAAYLYAEGVTGDNSTDDKRTWIQVVPTKFRLVGVGQEPKAYVEDYSNATAGVMLKRPFAVVRRYGC